MWDFCDLIYDEKDIENEYINHWGLDSYLEQNL